MMVMKLSIAKQLLLPSCYLLDCLTARVADKSITSRLCQLSVVVRDSRGSSAGAGDGGRLHFDFLCSFCFIPKA